nr:hypothetical protein BaRGS_020710 [Batillaria attramentaria]
MSRFATRSAWSLSPVMFLFTYHSMARHLPALLQAFRRHQDNFGEMHVPSARLKVVITRFLWAITAANILATVFGDVALLYDGAAFRNYLVPFENTRGIWYMASVVFVSAMLFLCGVVLIFCITAFTFLSHVMSCELRGVGREMHMLLCSDKSDKHDKACSPLAAIFAADWSTLPDSLLHKIGGTFVTYAVVVIQFQLSAQETSRCDVNTTTTTY